MDRLESMRAFAAVATHGNFAEASRRLRLSTSVISRAVAALEDHLGFVLFHRTTRTVRLTERGEAYLESCRQILEDIDLAEARVRGVNAAPQGTLTVAAPIVFGRLHVLPVVNQLLAEHPALSVRLILSDRNAHLAEEAIDVAVRIGPLQDSSLTATRLGAVNRMLAASPAYLRARGAPQTPEELASHDLIAFDGIDGSSSNEWRFGKSAATVRVRPRLLVNSADAAVASAEADRGIVRAMSYQLHESIRAGRLIPVLTELAMEPLPVSAIYPPRRIASASLNAFLDAARTRFKAHPVRLFEEWDLPPSP
ncbi:LysR family transcriptional regulator [Gimibacter soli]|uniref:LysR family transcriptional regulator n=1 Tax=Gimibacter soli TaxID=3024400 RepID=A0AAE9XQ54_9PROT|nr:LysR family transcriptional regulator [Gimibacter soli]WCL55137.1 LysR family transcriptional regulator [Gimibacter soli]